MFISGSDGSLGRVGSEVLGSGEGSGDCGRSMACTYKVKFVCRPVLILLMSSANMLQETYWWYKRVGLSRPHSIP